MSLEYYGYPEDYLDKYTQRIRAVTAKGILAAAKKYWVPERLQFVVVGKEKDFDVQLRDFGPVQKADLSIRE